jgi:hypothetical protein
MRLALPNNYRVFHDVSRGKLVFIPHGLDQLLGSGAAARTLRPHFTGVVARGLMTTPEGRRRYMERIASLAAKEFQGDALQARVDQMAAKLRKGLSAEPELLNTFDQRVNYIKSNLARRSQAVAQLLGEPARPVKFDAANTAILPPGNSRRVTPALRAEGEPFSMVPRCSRCSLAARRRLVPGGR